MEVPVKKKHIKRGLVKSFTHHTVCLAIRDAVKEQFGVPDFKILLLPYSGYGFLDGAVWEIPVGVLTYIADIDGGKEEEEAIFEIEDFPPDGFFDWKIKRGKPNDGRSACA